MKSIYVKTSTYMEYGDKDPKFKVGYYIRVSKYNIFAN